MADVSISDIVQRVRDLLVETGHLTSPYQTTSTTTTTSTTVAVPDGTLWVQGDIGEWQTGTVGYEQFWVTAAPVANNLVVVRGYNGTTAETHTSGDVVVQNPTITGRAIQQAAQRAVDSLWPRVWKTGTVTLAPVAGQTWYDLNALTRGLVNVTQKFGTSPDLRNGVYVAYSNDVRKDSYRPVMFDLDVDTGVVASGKGVAFPAGLYHTTNSINVRDKRTITGTSDIPDDGELPVAEACVYLAVARCLEGAEGQRVNQGVDLEEQGSLNPGPRLQTGAYFRSMGKEKLDAIETALNLKYTPLRFWR